MEWMKTAINKNITMQKKKIFKNISSLKAIFKLSQSFSFITTYFLVQQAKIIYCYPRKFVFPAAIDQQISVILSLYLPVSIFVTIHHNFLKF